MLLGIVYPFVVTGLAQVLFPRQANGGLITRERKDRRLAPDRPAVFLARIFSLAPLRGGQRLRRRQLGRLESRPHQQNADRPHDRRHPKGPGRKSGRAGPDGPGHHVRLGPRPAHFPGSRGLSGSANRSRAQHEREPTSAPSSPTTPKAASSDSSASPASTSSN